MTDVSRLLRLLPAAVVLATLSGCGGPPGPDKHAAPLAPALEALGLRGLTWDKAVLDGDSIVLLNAKADLEGVGPVHASEISVSKFAPSDSGWSASVVRADLVDGSINARRIVVSLPIANRQGKSWTIRDGGRTVEGYEGMASGLRLSALRAGVETVPPQGSRPASRRFLATGLRLLTPDLPASLAPFGGLNWDVSLRATTLVPERATYEIERAEAEGWSVRGTINLAGPAGFASPLPSLKAEAIADPRQWPEGVLLRDADLDLNLPNPALLFGAHASDNLAGLMAAAGTLGTPVHWHVSATPREPIPVRTLPETFRAPGADATLGLSVSGTGLQRPGPR